MPVVASSPAGKEASAGGSRAGTQAGRSATSVMGGGGGVVAAASGSPAIGGAGSSARAGSPGGTTAPASAAGASGMLAAGAGAGAAGSAGANVLPSAAYRCPTGPFGDPLPMNVSAQRVEGLPPSDAFNDMGRTRTNVEGAVWIGDTLYVSEFPFLPMPGSRVLALGPSNAVSVALASSGSNGLAVDGSGNLIAADHTRGAIVRMSFPLGTPTVLAGTYQGARFNSPNDLAVRSDGNIYFSDPDYQAPSQKPQKQTRVYRLAPGASEVSVIDATRSQPNGVTLSADERTLYAAGSDGILTYSLQSDGSVMPGPGKRINGFNGSADGLGMDCAGNLYAASGKRVVVVSPAGTEIGSIAVDQAESLTNVAFGGAEHKTLFITSMGTGTSRGVWKTELQVPGFPY